MKIKTEKMNMIKKIQKRKESFLNRISIRTQLLVLITTIIFAIIAVITIFNYSRSSDLIIDQILGTNKALLSLEGQNFSTYISDIDNFSLTLRNDTTFLQTIASENPLSYPSITYMQSLLKSAFYSRSDLKSYKLYLLNKNAMLSINSGNMKINFSTFDDFDSLPAYGEYTRAPNYRYLLPSDEEDVFMTYYRTIIDVTSRTPLAIVELAISMDYVYSLSDIHENLNNCFCIFDKAGLCYFTNDYDIIGGESASGLLDAIVASDSNYYYTSRAGTQYLIVREELKDFYLVTFTPTAKIRDSLAATRTISFLLGFFSILVAITLVTYFIRMITSPLSVLANHMKEAGHGNFSLTDNLTGSSEIYHLTKRYNAMLTEIDDLIKKNYIAKYNEERAKLIALEAQINPHFINNTLQAIATEAIVNGQSSIYNMITALASMQRYAIKGPELVLIESEMEQVEQYMYLQKYRLADSLTYEADIDEAMLDQLIPKLSIMALVENSIIHGITGSKSSIHICVHIYPEGGKLIVEVTDNGAGISESRLNEIYDMMEDNVIQTAHTQNIGLLNLNSRLKILYNNASRLIIRSNENEGTTVLLSIPLEGADTDA